MLQTVYMVLGTSSIPLTRQPGACCKPSITVTVVFISTFEHESGDKVKAPLPKLSRMCVATPRHAARLKREGGCAYRSQAYVSGRLDLQHALSCMRA